MKRYAFKVSYPDGDVEFWETIVKDEVKRLENLYGEKLIIKRIEYATPRF